ISLSAALQTQLTNLRVANGFHYLGTYYQGYDGSNEKWLKDRHDNWFALLPSGDLVKWDGVSFVSSVANVATTVHLDPLVYDDPTLLFNAPISLSAALQTQLTNLRIANGFHYLGTYYQGYDGSNEKWFHDRTEHWYALLPSGDLIKWDGVSFATSV